MPPGTSMQLRNVAAVMVTAQLPAFAQPGQRDRRQRFVARQRQEPARRHADRHAAERRRRPDLRAGARQPDRRRRGCIGRRLEGADQSPERRARAGTARRSSAACRRRWPQGDFAAARPERDRLQHRTRSGARDQRSARATAPRRRSTAAWCACACRPMPHARVAFLADIENLDVTLAAPAAKIVINARTGSVVMNQSVTLGDCAVAHGTLSVTISSTPVISQPNPLSQGQTVVAEKADITIAQQAGSLMQMPAGAKLADVVKALNALGATPQDLLAILQAMKTRRRAERRARGDLNGRRGPHHRPRRTTLARIDALRSAAAHDPKAAVSEAAKQFEALFMQELMKSMRAARRCPAACSTTTAAARHRAARCAVRHQVDRPARRPGRRDRAPARAPDGPAPRPMPEAGARRQMPAAPAAARRAFPSSAPPVSSRSTSTRPRAARSDDRHPGRLHDRPGGARDRLGQARDHATPTARRRTTCSASRPAPTGTARWPRSRPPSTSTAKPRKVTAKFRAYAQPRRIVCATTRG